MTLRGLTWDHPRAYRPLQALAAHCPDIAVSWDRQSLADFEARPITTLAQSYDLMIIDHPGLVWNCATGAPAHLQLGRAYASKGDKVKARAAYQDFLTLWKDADADIPLLREAKAEFARLQ